MKKKAILKDGKGRLHILWIDDYIEFSDDSDPDKGREKLRSDAAKTGINLSSTDSVETITKKIGDAIKLL